jgi:hypothetical protein
MRYVRRADRPMVVGPRASTSVDGMSTHRGTAVLLLEDGRELAAEANLSKDGVGNWSGTLTFPAAAKTPELLNSTEATLRIGGRDSKFLRPDTADWVGSPAGQVRIRIVGNDDAPF